MINEQLETLANEVQAQIAPLYQRFSGQRTAQPAYLTLDDRTVSVGASGEIGNAMPMAVWHGRVRRWSLPHDVTGSALADLLRVGLLARLLDTVADGLTIEWDGHNNVGRLSQAAEDASVEIGILIKVNLEDESTRAIVWHTGDWIAPCPLGDLWRDDETIEQAADRLEHEARAEGILLDGDLRRELRWRAQHAIASGDRVTDLQRQAATEGQ